MLRSPEHWRNFVDEARTLAENMGSTEGRSTMLETACQYDVLAARSKRLAEVFPDERPKDRRM